MPTYNTLFIDADDTLFDFGKAESESLRLTFNALDLEATPQIFETYKKINKQLWLSLEQGTISQQQLRSERFRLLFESADINLDPIHASKVYIHHLGNSSFLLDGAIELCERIHRNHKVVIITNGIPEVQKSRLQGSEIARFVDIMVVSEEEGCSKPDPRIFEIAVERLGPTSKDQILMVGDSKSSDIQGAINFGIDSCWYNPHGASSSPNIVPTFEIRKLDELVTIFEPN